MKLDHSCTRLSWISGPIFLPAGRRSLNEWPVEGKYFSSSSGISAKGVARERIRERKWSFFPGNEIKRVTGNELVWKHTCPRIFEEERVREREKENGRVTRIFPSLLLFLLFRERERGRKNTLIATTRKTEQPWSSFGQIKIFASLRNDCQPALRIITFNLSIKFSFSLLQLLKFLYVFFKWTSPCYT